MIKNLYYCRKCGSIDKSKFSEFRGILCCTCCGSIGYKNEFTSEQKQPSFWCFMCQADSEKGAKFAEWKGVVICLSCGQIGDKAGFTVRGTGHTAPECDDMLGDPCGCSLKKAVQSLTEQSNENTLAVALMFDKMNRLEQKLPDE